MDRLPYAPRPIPDPRQAPPTDRGPRLSRRTRLAASAGLALIGLVAGWFHPVIGGALVLVAAAVGVPFLLLAWFRR